MGFFDSKHSTMGAALGVSGAFDKNRKTDKAAAFGAALGASIGSGKEWTMADSLRLAATINALDSAKEDLSYNDSSVRSSYENDVYYTNKDYSVSYERFDSSNNKYDNLIMTSEQEEQLEKAGIDTFDFECMDDKEKLKALEDAGLDPFDFDMYE